MFGLGFWEIGLILLVALLVLGPKKLPELAKTLGKGLRELRRASEDIRSSISEPLDEVRKPLQDLRDDLVGTVYNVKREIEREARLETVPDEGGEEGVEVEKRRREVEELYQTASKEDQLLETSVAADEAHPEEDAGDGSGAKVAVESLDLPRPEESTAAAEVLPDESRSTPNPVKS